MVGFPAMRDLDGSMEGVGMLQLHHIPAVCRCAMEPAGQENKRSTSTYNTHAMPWAAELKLMTESWYCRAMVGLAVQLPAAGGLALAGQMYSPHLDTHQRLLLLDCLGQVGLNTQQSLVHP